MGGEERFGSQVEAKIAIVDKRVFSELGSALMGGPPARVLVFSS
jgi:hypothetical protein